MNTQTTTAPTMDRRRRQRMEALEKANRRRTKRAEIKRDLGTHPPVQSRQATADLLTDPPADLRGMEIADLLAAIPGFGPVRVRQTLRRRGISPLRPLDRLSAAERAELASALLNGSGWALR